MQVRKTAESVNDVWCFVNAVQKFGKKFYSVMGRHEGGKYKTCIVAIGVSRDLKYILFWSINSETHGPSSKIAWMPKSEEDKLCLFPQFKKDNFSDIFEMHGFVHVGCILDDDGKNLTEMYQ